MANEISESELKERKRLSIFISYGHTDSGKVKPIVNALAQQGYRVWFDKENILPGQIWRRDIVKGIVELIFILCPRRPEKRF